MKRNTCYMCIGVCCLILLLILTGGEGGSGGTSDGGKVVYENQDRNAPCRRDRDCLDGLECEGATRDAPGKCVFECKEDADCGNGYLCRSGECQRDCAEVGEKCSNRRVCCFYDADGDKNSDAECRTSEEEDELRCRV